MRSITIGNPYTRTRDIIITGIHQRASWKRSKRSRVFGWIGVFKGSLTSAFYITDCHSFGPPFRPT